MPINKPYHFVLILCVALSSCIERFYFGAEEYVDDKIVIDGLITNDGNLQEVVISRPSSPEAPRFIPERGCLVTIEDDRKNIISMAESENPGHYQSIVSSGFLKVGSDYRLVVKTAKGTQYASSFEKMMPCPAVDLVYYEDQIRPTSEIGNDERGIRFFVDFKADESMGRLYRLQLEETWEYHSTWSINRFIDENDNLQIIPEDFSNYVCYKTDPIYDIYTLSTVGFTQNRYTRYPLHFVNNETQRLLYHYSLLIKQYSLTPGAYNYWENLRKNSKETSSLYYRQPVPLNGNIRNLNDTTEKVLGYFGVSQVNQKRIHIRFIPGMTFNKVKYCPEIIKPYASLERPLYLFPYNNKDGTILWTWSDTDCFFCQMHGGTTQRPSYWDDK